MESSKGALSNGCNKVKIMKTLRFCVVLFFAAVMSVLVSGCAQAPKAPLDRQDRPWKYLNAQHVCCDGEKNPHKKGTKEYDDFEKSLDYLEGLVMDEADIIHKMNIAFKKKLGFESDAYLPKKGSKETNKVYIWGKEDILYAVFVDMRLLPPIWKHDYEYLTLMTKDNEDTVYCSRGCRLVTVYFNVTGPRTLEWLCKRYDLDCEHPL